MDGMANGPRGAEGAANVGVIVANPKNGEILAMAPDNPYDLNNPRDLTSYYSQDEINGMDNGTMLKNLYGIWKNYCISDAFEPGSTVKPLTIGAALDADVVQPSDTFVCDGYQMFGGTRIRCSIYPGAHGTETLSDLIKHSCNDGLMQIGALLGPEEFLKYQKIFNFGATTGIDLPGEAAGLLYSLEDMDSSTLATKAFGQNFNVTMTQMAASFCSLLNGGNYYEPHVVKQIQDENGNVTENKDPVLVKKTISKETSDIIKDYMLGVVEEGTGASAAVEGYAVGGKTGTAEKLPRGNGKYLVSFIGYAPQENPQVMVYVVIDEPNSAVQANSGYATQLASQIMTDIFPYLGVEKKDGASDTIETSAEETTTQTAQE